MQMELEPRGRVLIVRPREERIDALSSTRFKGQMVDAMNEGHRYFVLDLSEVRFIDSSGLGALVSSLKSLGGEGELVLCGVKDTVAGLFRLTRMNRVFRLFDSCDEAAQALEE